MYKYLYRLMLTLYFILMTFLTGIVIYLIGFIFFYSYPIYDYFTGNKEFGFYDIVFWTVLISISVFISLSLTVTSGRDYLLYDLKFCELLKSKPTE